MESMDMEWNDMEMNWNGLAGLCKRYQFDQLLENNQRGRHELATQRSKPALVDRALQHPADDNQRSMRPALTATRMSCAHTVVSHTVSG